jgi:hypothetical protein
VENRDGRGNMKVRRNMEGMGNRESRINMEVRRNMEEEIGLISGNREGMRNREDKD